MTHLQAIIENYRDKMVKLAGEHGLSSPQTLECSQKLDQLLNLLEFSEQGNSDAPSNEEK